MSTDTITINGVIAWSTLSNRLTFLPDWSKDWFTDGVTQNYVFIREYTINAEIPSVDLLQLQLDALDAQETDLTAKYQAVKTEIEAKRQSLLAIELAGN